MADSVYEENNLYNDNLQYTMKIREFLILINDNDLREIDLHET